MGKRQPSRFRHEIEILFFTVRGRRRVCYAAVVNPMMTYLSLTDRGSAVSSPWIVRSVAK